MLSIMRMQALHHFMRTQVLTSVLLLTLQARRSYSASNTVTIRNEAAFKAMRECARDCFVFNGSIDLIGEFGCIWPYMNECLCRADLAPQATKHLSTCCDTYCTGAADVDISSAIQVYYSYCSDNGYDVKASAEAAEAGIVPVKTTAASGNGLFYLRHQCYRFFANRHNEQWRHMRLPPASMQQRAHLQRQAAAVAQPRLVAQGSALARWQESLLDHLGQSLAW